MGAGGTNCTLGYNIDSPASLQVCNLEKGINDWNKCSHVKNNIKQI